MRTSIRCNCDVAATDAMNRGTLGSASRTNIRHAFVTEAVFDAMGRA
jgi:hypothetical protein